MHRRDALDARISIRTADAPAKVVPDFSSLSADDQNTSLETTGSGAYVAVFGFVVAVFVVSGGGIPPSRSSLLEIVLRFFQLLIELIIA